MTVGKEELLNQSLPVDEVEIPGKGTVRVRGLSRAEALDELRKVDRSVSGAYECRLVSLSLVEPALTDDEVRLWRESSTSPELDVVLEAISVLSGMTKAAAKAAYKELASDSDAEFRDVPGGEAGDDGGAAEG